MGLGLGFVGMRWGGVGYDPLITNTYHRFTLFDVTRPQLGDPSCTMSRPDSKDRHESSEVLGRLKQIKNIG